MNVWVLLALMNKVAAGIQIHIFTWIYVAISVGYVLRRGTVGYTVTLGSTV